MKTILNCLLEPYQHKSYCKQYFRSNGKLYPEDYYRYCKRIANLKDRAMLIPAYIIVIVLGIILLITK